MLKNFLQVGVHDQKSLDTTDPEESPLLAAVPAQKLRKSSCYSSARCHPCNAEGREGRGETIHHLLPGRGSATSTLHNSETSYAKCCRGYRGNQPGKQHQNKPPNPRENAFCSPSILHGDGSRHSHSRGGKLLLGRNTVSQRSLSACNEIGRKQPGLEHKAKASEKLPSTQHREKNRPQWTDQWSEIHPKDALPRQTALARSFCTSFQMVRLFSPSFILSRQPEAQQDRIIALF